MFSLEASRGAAPPSVNLGPLISRFLFVDYFASNYFYVFHSCIPSTGLLSRSWVKVKRRSKLCEVQPLCHSALWCCLVLTTLTSPFSANYLAHVVETATLLDIVGLKVFTRWGRYIVDRGGTGLSVTLSVHVIPVITDTLQIIQVGENGITRINSVAACLYNFVTNEVLLYFTSILSCSTVSGTFKFNAPKQSILRPTYQKISGVSHNPSLDSISSGEGHPLCSFLTIPTLQYCG